MPNPKDVFDHPEKYWPFLTKASDNDFEDQHFDRKEAGQPGLNGEVERKTIEGVKQQLIECVSAFANANREGGLLVLGISKKGEIKGVSHLRDEQLNSLTSFRDTLKNQAVLPRSIDCINVQGNADRIIFLYVPYAPNGICETLDSHIRAWYRYETQNLLVNDQLRDQIKAEKHLTDFERSYCCNYSSEEVDPSVLKDFRKAYLENSLYDLTDEEILFRVGACFCQMKTSPL